MKGGRELERNMGNEGDDKEEEEMKKLQHVPNLYWDVKDFHWLKNNVKSPNFDVYTDQEMALQDVTVHPRGHPFGNGGAAASAAINIEGSSSTPVETDVPENGGEEDNDDSSEDEL